MAFCHPDQQVLPHQIATKVFPCIRNVAIGVSVERYSRSGCIVSPVCFCQGQLSAVKEGMKVAMTQLPMRFPDLEEKIIWSCGHFPDNSRTSCPQYNIAPDLKKNGARRYITQIE